MTPPHGIPLKDTGEREAAKRPEPKEVATMTPPGFDLNDTDERAAAAEATDQRFAHFFRCWDREGGPGYQLRGEVNEIKTGFIDMTATIRTWGRAIAGAVTLLSLAVALLGYLQMRDKPAPQIVHQAHAETKGTP